MNRLLMRPSARSGTDSPDGTSTPSCNDASRAAVLASDERSQTRAGTGRSYAGVKRSEQENAAGQEARLRAADPEHGNAVRVG